MIPPDAPDLGAREEARRALRRADRGVALTGAGVSAASGVPTFRGEEGLWRDYRPEELATPDAFSKDPVTVWQWYRWRRRTVASCEPNEAHGALARWTLRREGARLVTQNVDDLHRRALHAAAGDGPTPDHARPVELHGSLFRTLCTGCGRRRGRREEIDASSADALPRCGDCGELLRPDVVWFGESLPRQALDAAVEAARRAEVCLVAGTSAAVQPAASVAAVAADAGALLVEVNPERTPLTGRSDHAFRAGAEQVLPALLDDSPPGPPTRPDGSASDGTAEDPGRGAES